MKSEVNVNFKGLNLWQFAYSQIVKVYCYYLKIRIACYENPCSNKDAMK